MDKIKATGEAAGLRLAALLAKQKGKRLTRAVRDELGDLADPLREAGGVCDVLAAVELKRRSDGFAWLVDLDMALLDAAFAAGVPAADPPPGLRISLAAWHEAGARGDLAAVAADPRFRLLLRDAVLGRRGDLLALGRPDCALRDTPGFADAVLATPGLVATLHEAVTTWAAAAAAGSLPALHEAVHYLDLIGPARLAAACPQARAAIDQLLGADVPDLLAATWRNGLADELGDLALDAYDGFTHSDDLFRLEPAEGADEDAFVLTGGNRSIAFGPRGVIAGPVAGALPWPSRSPASPSTDRRIRYTSGRFGLGDEAPGDTAPVHLPGAARASALQRGPDAWWELRNPAGAATSRWYQGPSRPTHVSGSHTVARQRHRWAAGSELVVPPQAWGRLAARDSAASRILRAADRAAAARVLAALDGGLADRLTEIGRRIPVGNPSHEIAEAFADLRKTLADTLPGITSDRLLDGIAGTVWTAAECQVLSARNLDATAPGTGRTLRADPLPYPRIDAGDLRARIFTGMQEMFLELARVADACTDPKVAVPPQTARLADALGWELQLGRLGGRALRTVLHGLGPDRSNDLRADHIRCWGVPHMSDPAGRWRTLRLDLGRDPAPAQGTVCRTPNGCLVVLQSGSTVGLAALEYAVDGAFGPPPFGTVLEQRVCRGWGGMDRIAALLRQLDEHGPAPWPAASVEAFAAATGTTAAQATVLALGFEPRDAYLLRRGGSGVSAALALASGLPGGALDEASRELAAEVSSDERLDVHELLMPDDPLDVWRDRLAVDRAAAWWNGRKGRG
ncbi:hypothetical protein [Yinghuangia soli]|uniref:Uncharacterized protein n=1 Tax=Yinghuangia soli TaxID=2908204 RepID=A0AA41U348_9ACTN|nr:hypothetical protein [Yinghuangia soli]MCF2532408.1 hypothetical protein [Yinghuangia soli]